MALQIACMRKAESIGVRGGGRPPLLGRNVWLNGGVCRNGIVVTLHVGEVVLEVRRRVDDGRVSHREDIVEREVGIRDCVGSEEKALAFEDRVKPFLYNYAWYHSKEKFCLSLT